MKLIYCISGLGADERIFQKLHITGAELVHISWPVITATDTMRSYAAKIAKQITEKEPIILGVSFGGMLATEIAKLIPVKKVILVSSAKTRKELGYNFPLWKFLVNKHMVPFRLFKLIAPISRYRLGVKTKEERILIDDMMRNIQIDFIKHAMHVIVNWDNVVPDKRTIQIHGTDDKIIFSANAQPTYWIQEGGHFMIFNKADEISKLITANI